MKKAARPSPHCRALLLELSRHLDGELTAPRRRAIERHLAACDCCGTLAVRLRRTIDACRASGSPRLPADVRARARARITRLMETRHDHTRTDRS
ncbi:MAG TPA: zf-HC2 domain-containing protein [Vicinamibacterales bacterium]